MKMLEDLAEVVRLSDAASGGNWSWSECGNILTDAPKDGCDPEIAAVYTEHDDASEPANSTVIRAAIAFIRTHHATIADMAKRLEAAERDAPRLEWLIDQMRSTDYYFIVGDMPSTMHVNRKSIDAAMQETGR